MKKYYTVYCSWAMTGQVFVEAKNEEEARKKVNSGERPTGGDYLSDSFKIDDVEES